MNEETCRKVRIGLVVVLCGLGEVRAPIRANCCGTLPLEHFLSHFARRQSRQQSLSEHDGNAQACSPLMTTIRRSGGLGRDLEEGTKRQKRGDVRIRALPASTEDVADGHCK
jgi:hypothetical protein